ncbi:hypothetical protein [Weissella halotolerans]|uniref:IrrE N-terminal-like domain-containing protein n=1 Tax=Weissella halotolerans DSM 20190 TaxID=1123500 RepID=A0A0R2FYH0_9LACO|nr:hypothetical protein [Weissella halotolerans]KRN33216.1 hypothetical protein IV68_GL000014 [Weissella halotolerans DSM 20190]
MQTNRYDDLLMAVEDDLQARGLEPIILDTMPLKENSGLAGVTSIKGDKVYIFIDKTLSTFEKAETLVEEYFHALFDLGNILDYESARAHNNEINARENVLTYMTSLEEIQAVAADYPDEPLAGWMLTERFGYPLTFSDETLRYYQRRGML